MPRFIHRLPCVLLLLLCAAPVRADSAQVLAVDHRVSGALETKVDTRWVLEAPVHQGDYFELTSALPRGTTLESADVSPMRDAEHRISALVARRELPAELSLSTRLDDEETEELPLASPKALALVRVRFVTQRRTQLSNAETVQHLGIRMAEHMSRAERRRADQLLDGAQGHRRLGALYFRSHDGPLQMLPGADEQRRGSLRVVVALLFVVLLGAGIARLRQARRRLRDERIDAYLKQALPECDRELFSSEEE